MHAQGLEQPTSFYQTSLIKRDENPYIIVKEMYEVNGSQATNIGWLNVNGQYMWYLKNEMDARKRFMNEREMMLLYSEANDGSSVTVGSGSIVPSEGYLRLLRREVSLSLDLQQVLMMILITSSLSLTKKVRLTSTLCTS